MENIRKKLKETLDPERYEHSLRVEKSAIELAQKYGVSVEDASIAGLLHDCSRKYTKQEMLEVAQKIGLEIDPIRKLEPKLFHAEISAHMAEKEFGIRSKEVLQAIRVHTVGSENMSTLDKIVYLADHIEEGRDFIGVDHIRNLAYKDLDKAVFESVSNMLKFLVGNNLPIYPQTIAVRNRYLLNINK
ncbi:MAG: bis(5'-nucleosyl)-tetraphosphatase (symmetrical) YqeK [Candidatus Margulisiibacteriota bacterium]